jgi:hypothetical protein
LNGSGFGSSVWMLENELLGLFWCYFLRLSGGGCFPLHFDVNFTYWLRRDFWAVFTLILINWNRSGFGSRVWILANGG